MSEAADLAIARAAAAIVERGSVAALTGAGISVESGIPDFRSSGGVAGGGPPRQGGIWKKYDPRLYATIDAFRRDPERVWVFLRDVGDLLARARPNAAHAALAELERLGGHAGGVPPRKGLLRGIATQNIDGLHQAAGSKRVIELHGSGQRLRCIECAREVPPEEAQGAVPRCLSCGGLVKPDVVLFGEMLPAGALEDAERLLREARVLLIVGTSGEVHPVAGLPRVAREAGALLVEMNLGETDLTDDCDIAIHGRAGETLPRLVKQVRERLEKR